MARMRKHSPTADSGIAAVNGHAPTLVPLTIPAAMQPRQGGPASPWPQSAKRDKGERRRHAIAAARRAAASRGWLAAIPVVLVNTVAFSGQLAFLRHHLPWTPAGQVLVAVTLESVAVYLAWQAHVALAADDSALRLRLAAYGFAAVIGAMNYSHYMAPHWHPTLASVTFGMMSVTSPWLWSVHSRRQSRDALRAKGLIESHAVRLGATRWTWHPLRSARVMWHATWQGENDPAKAIALAPERKADRSRRVTKKAAREVTPAPPADVTPELAPSQAQIQAAEPVSRQPEATQPPAPKVRSRRKPEVRPAVTSPRISDADLKAEIRALFDADTSVTVSATAKATSRSRDRVRPLLEQVRAESARQ